MNGLDPTRSSCVSISSLLLAIEVDMSVRISKYFSHQLVPLFAYRAVRCSRAKFLTSTLTGGMGAGCCNDKKAKVKLRVIDRLATGDIEVKWCYRPGSTIPIDAHDER